MRGIIAVIYLSGYFGVVLTRRSNTLSGDMTSVENNRQHLSSDELPESTFPGHSLIKPVNLYLNSAFNYPNDNKDLVYGNLDNLGITYDNTPESPWYTGFRKENDPLEKVLKLIKEMSRNKGNHGTSQRKKYTSKILSYSPLKDNSMKIKRDTEMRSQYLLNNGGQGIQTHLPLHKKTQLIQDFLNDQITVGIEENNKLKISEEENNANEVMDQFSSEEDSKDGFWNPDHRRMRGKKKKDRDSKYKSSSNSKSFESASSDYEKNPGNPYTIHRDKYKKNWLWNHALDGNHMNINPLAPQFANNRPSGAELFFGRKWWYYNQDDYKPMA